MFNNFIHGALERELAKIEQAEQYVLKAGVAGHYPCYGCLGKTDIWLNLNEVWKYGVTTSTQKERYRMGLPHPGLLYEVEYQGPLPECLRLEKIKIYNYALLPENLRRAVPLIRPPGNKIDR